MKLTIEEKRVIFQILNVIMKADLIVRQEELDFLDDIFYRFELSVDEFDHIDNIDIDYLRKEYAGLSNEVKEFAYKLFMDMANCDHYVDPREIAIINTL